MKRATTFEERWAQPVIKPPRGYRVVEGERPRFMRGAIGVLGTVLICQENQPTGIPGQRDLYGWRASIWTKNGWSDVSRVIHASPAQAAAEVPKQRGRAPRANPVWLIPALRAAATLALPYVVEALGSSLTAFRAAPLAEQRTQLRAVLRSRVLFAAPATAFAARQLAKSDQGVDMLCRLIGSHGAQALTAGTVAAQRAVAAAPAAKANPRGIHWRDGASGYSEPQPGVEDVAHAETGAWHWYVGRRSDGRYCLGTVESGSGVSLIWTRTGWADERATTIRGSSRTTKITEPALYGSIAAAKKAAIAAPAPGTTSNPRSGGGVALRDQFGVDWSVLRFSRDAERRILRAQGLVYLGQDGAGDDVYALTGTPDRLYLKTFTKRTAAGKFGQIYVAKAPKGAS